MTFNAVIAAAGTPVMVRATSGSVTGSWGTGQNRTGGNLLVAIVTAGGTTASAAALSVPGGWAQGWVSSNTPTTANAWAAIYLKVAGGSDAAPTFTATLSGTVAMTCTLIELIAADNAVAFWQPGYGYPADIIATYSSGASAATLSAITVAAAAGQVTSAPGSYAIAVFCQEAAAATNTWNGPGAPWSNLVNDGATSSVLHTAVDVQSGIAAAAAPTETGNWTADTSAFGAAILAVFAPQCGGFEKFANSASTTISAGGTTAPAAGTPEIWTAASWSSFPAASNVPPQRLFRVADPAATSETIAVLNTATGLVIRGVDGTVPVVHTAGFTIQNVISTGFLELASRDIVVQPATGVIATDSANIRRALSIAHGYGGSTVALQNGLYQFDTGQLYIPPNTRLVIPQNGSIQINCTAGSAVDAISIDAASSIVSPSKGSVSSIYPSILVGTGVNCRSLISNHWHSRAPGSSTPGQEWFYLDGIYVSAFHTATYAVAVLDMEYCFTNSGVKDCIINGSGGSAVPIVNVVNGGPLYFRECSFGQGSGHIMSVTVGTDNLWIDNCEIDTPGSGFCHLTVDGTAQQITNLKICGLHMENNATDTATTPMIKLAHTWSVTIDDWGMFTQDTTNSIGLWITSNDVQRVSVRGAFNNNGMTTVLQDDVAGKSYGGHIHEYNGPEVGYALPVHIGPFIANDFRPVTQSVALASTAVDAVLGNVIAVAALAAAVTVAAPSNPQPNQILTYRFQQNGTGGFAVTWNAVFRVASGVVSTTANAVSTVTFWYDNALSKWVQLSATTGV